MTLPKRQSVAKVLCLASKGIVGFMAVITGIGLTVALIVLAANGTISVGAAIVAWFLVLPLVEMVIFLLSAALAFVPLGIAKLLDRASRRYRRLGVQSRPRVQRD